MVWLGSIDVSSKTLPYHGTNHKTDEKNKTFYLGYRVSKKLD